MARRSAEDRLFDYLGRASIDPEVPPNIRRICRAARLAMKAAWAGVEVPPDHVIDDRVDAQTRWLFRGMKTRW
jgi:hypothetical protein